MKALNRQPSGDPMREAVAAANSERGPRAPSDTRGRMSAFGRFLADRGIVAQAELARAEHAAEEVGERLDRALVRLGLIGSAEMARQSAAFLALDFVEPSDLPPQALVVPGLTAAYQRKANLVAIGEEAAALVIATSDPFQPDVQSALEFLLDRPIRLVVSEERHIERLLSAGDGTSAAGAASTVATPIEGRVTAREDDVRRLTDMASDAPIIRLVQDIIARAVERNASDIHLEPIETGLIVRLRTDGLLEVTETLPLHTVAAVVSRIKVMARLDIAERRMPQDGRIRVNVRGQEIDLRVATMPSLKGECVVLRILDSSSIALDFTALGFSGPILTGFTGLLDLPHGLILVTGPTGSGKSTTLSTALGRLNQPFRKVFSIEDPVEHQMQGVTQVQINPRIGLTFASSLRSILRHDPDVIMVGEIRDIETADMAVQAALTGHLVLSTLHTNSATATIARLIDMGVDDYLIASTLRGCLAQRLVRRLCSCAEDVEPSPALRACIDDLSSRHAAGRLPASRESQRVRAPRGCAVCRNTGFKGRLAIAELMQVTPRVAAAIVDRAGHRPIETAAADQEQPHMLADGIQKVLEGHTTFEEILRATRVS